MSIVRSLFLTLSMGAGLLALSGRIKADLPAPSGDLTDSAADVTIEGTEWLSKEEGPNRNSITYHFEKEGVLVYSYGGTTYRNGKWKQDGDTVYFEMNNKYRECRAKLLGDRIEGDSWNVAGNKWTTIMVRSEAKK